MQSTSTRNLPDARSLRLAEVVAALSLASDLGTGHSLERSLRAWLLALQLGAALRMSDQELSEVYYVTLVRWAGWTADSHRADLFGDEIGLGVQIDSVELWNPAEMLRFLFEQIGVGQPPLRRAGQLAYALATG